MVQVMSAGTGIVHLEYNREDIAARIFQIWLLPDRAGAAPSWGTRAFPRNDRRGRFVALASGYEADRGALPIRTSARVVAATLAAGERARYALGAGRRAYLVPAAGTVEIAGLHVAVRDGVSVADVESEIILVDAA